MWNSTIFSALSVLVSLCWLSWRLLPSWWKLIMVPTENPSMPGMCSDPWYYCWQFCLRVTGSWFIGLSLSGSLVLFEIWALVSSLSRTNCSPQMFRFFFEVTLKDSDIRLWPSLSHETAVPPCSAFLVPKALGSTPSDMNTICSLPTLLKKPF